MTENYDRIEDGRNITEAEQQFGDKAIEFAPNSTMHRLFEALLLELDRTDENLEEIYEQQHISSATGDDLDQFGELVDVDRKTGEGDDKYRARIKTAFRASTMSATYDEFAEFCAAVLDTNVKNLEFVTNYGGDPATVRVSAPVDVYDALNITNAEVEDVLDDGVPAGHAVFPLKGGTFRLKADGDNDEAEKGLTSDSINTGGTLAADVVAQ